MNLISIVSSNWLDKIIVIRLLLIQKIFYPAHFNRNIYIFFFTNFFYTIFFIFIEIFSFSRVIFNFSCYNYGNAKT